MPAPSSFQVKVFVFPYFVLFETGSSHIIVPGSQVELEIDKQPYSPQNASQSFQGGIGELDTNVDDN